MTFTAEERLMYDIMEAIDSSGIPITFKGSMVLKACLLEAGYSDDTRHTVDIDANWRSEQPPTLEQMESSLQKAISQCRDDLLVKSFRDYGEKQSAGFDIIQKEADEPLFSMDIDVNRPKTATRIYRIENVKFTGSAPAQIMADKIGSVSTDKVCRRIKDVVDLFYLSKVFSINKPEVLDAIKTSGRDLGDFDKFLNHKDDLEHAYEKFRFEGNVHKPAFQEVYDAVSRFIGDFLPQ